MSERTLNDAFEEAWNRAVEMKQAETVDQIRADARHYGVGIVKMDESGRLVRVPPEEFFA